MKKIPTVFVREFDNHRITGIKPEFTNERCKEAFLHGIATIKHDGSCCAIIGGQLYKRYDAKKGKPVPKKAPSKAVTAKKAPAKKKAAPKKAEESVKEEKAEKAPAKAKKAPAKKKVEKEEVKEAAKTE